MTEVRERRERKRKRGKSKGEKKVEKGENVRDECMKMEEGPKGW